MKCGCLWLKVGSHLLSLIWNWEKLALYFRLRKTRIFMHDGELTLLQRKLQKSHHFSTRIFSLVLYISFIQINKGYSLLVQDEFFCLVFFWFDVLLLYFYFFVRKWEQVPLDSSRNHGEKKNKRSFVVSGCGIVKWFCQDGVLFSGKLMPVPEFWNPFHNKVEIILRKFFRKITHNVCFERKMKWLEGFVKLSCFDCVGRNAFYVLANEWVSCCEVYMKWIWTACRHNRLFLHNFILLGACKY